MAKCLLRRVPTAWFAATRRIFSTSSSILTFRLRMILQGVQQLNKKFNFTKITPWVFTFHPYAHYDVVHFRALISQIFHNRSPQFVDNVGGCPGVQLKRKYYRLTAVYLRRASNSRFYDRNHRCLRFSGCRYRIRAKPLRRKVDH
jgi:hypothetical protein